jgi:hypothetical protein
MAAMAFVELVSGKCLQTLCRVQQQKLTSVQILKMQNEAVTEIRPTLH